MTSKKTTEERGLFKEEIHAALFRSNEIKKLLLGDTTGMSQTEIRDKFKEHVFSHLFVDDTIEESGTYVFYDVVFPRLSPNIKHCRVVLYIISHRDILDNYQSDQYHGNRADALSQMIEDALINDKTVRNKFGIGELSLIQLEPYNALRFYGCIMLFEVPNFR